MLVSGSRLGAGCGRDLISLEARRRLVAGDLHQVSPLRAVGTGALAIEVMDGKMCGLVAGHLGLKLRITVEEPGGEANEVATEVAKSQGAGHASAELDSRRRGGGWNPP